MIGWIMAHLSMALRDPIYWLALLLLAGALPIYFWALRESAPLWAKALAVVMLVLCLPSGCYAMLGTICYVGGSCP